MINKTYWHGVIARVQPRIALSRSFDQRSHSYLGYVLRLKGEVAGEIREFLVAIGTGAQKKHEFRVGDSVSGCAELVVNPKLEVAQFYRATNLKLLGRPTEPLAAPPPWLGMPPDLTVYRQRGHRRLSTGVHLGM
jgi:hypothetical protein